MVHVCVCLCVSAAASLFSVCLSVEGNDDVVVVVLRKIRERVVFVGEFCFESFFLFFSFPPLFQFFF